MTKLNLRWMAGLLIGTFCLAGITYLVHEYQMRKNAQAFLREAKRIRDEDRLEEAAIYLRRYIALAPNDPEGQIIYGEVLADMQRYQPAYFILDKVVQKHPDRDDVRRRLVKVAQEVHAYKEAIVHLDHLLVASPKDPELLEQLGICQSSKALFDEAAKSFKQSIENDPARVDASLRLAYVLRQKLDQPEEADTVMNDMVKKNPDNFRAYLTRARWWKECLADLATSKVQPKRFTPVKLRELADTDIAQAMKMEPDNLEVIGLATQVAIERGQPDEAKRQAQRGIELYPNEHRFYLMLAELESKSSHPAEAIAILKKGVDVIPAQDDLKWSLATLLIDAGDFEHAAGLISKLKAAKRPAPLIVYLEAQTKVRQGDWNAAIPLLETARLGLHDSPVLLRQVDLWLGMAFRESAMPERQLATLRRVANESPEWVPGRLQLAEALAASNHLDEAIVEYRQITGKPAAALPATVGIARSLLISNVRRPAGAQDWREFDEAINRLDQIGTTPGAAAVFRMEKLLAQDKREEAQKVVADAREKNPDLSELWISQISLAQTDGNYALVDSLVQEAIGRFGDTPTFRLLQARLISQRDGKNGLGQLQKLAEPKDDWTAQQKLQFSANIAPVLAAVGDYDDALNKLTAVSKVEPKNLRIRISQLEMAFQSKNLEVMKQVLEEVRSLTAEGAVWHYGEAIVLTLQAQTSDEAKNLARAMDHLEKARKLRPTWEKIPKLAGDIYEMRGDLKSAGDQYLEAVRLGERSQAVTNRTLALLCTEKRFEDADKLLRTIRESQGLLSDSVARVEVDLSLQFGRKDEALKAIEQLMKTSTKAQDHLWAGQVYATVEKFPEAEEHFRLAVKEHPEDPRPWLGLVQTLMVAKKTQEAEQAVEEAKAAISEDKSLLVIGRCYEILGKSDLAKANYQAAVEKDPNNFGASQNWIDYLLKTGAIGEAEPTIRKVIESSTGSDELSQSKLNWAQRKLVIALVSRGRREQLLEALNLVDRSLAGADKSIEDRRMKALILAGLGSRDQRREAIGLLERVLEQAPSASTANEDRFLVARLSLADGDLGKARTELQKLVGARRDDPRYLSAYIQLALQANETSEADFYLSALRKLAPDDLGTADLQTQVLYARNRFNDIAEVLKNVGSRAASAQEKPEMAAARKLWSAKKFEEFARLLTSTGKKGEAAKYNSEAERLYSQIAKDKGEEMLALAEFLARGTQVDRALDLFQEHGAVSPPFRIASVTFAVMKNPNATPAQLARTQDLLRKNEESHDHPILLTLVAADLLNWRGQFEEAAKMYREVLRRDPRNLAALNNLGVLLAFTGGDSDEATRLIQQAISIGGPKASLIDSRGLIHLAGGQPEKALVDFEQALREGENGERKFHYALTMAKLNQLKEAKKALNQAIELKLNQVDLHPLERPEFAKLSDQLKAVELP